METKRTIVPLHKECKTIKYAPVGLLQYLDFADSVLCSNIHAKMTYITC